MLVPAKQDKEPRTTYNDDYISNTNFGRFWLQKESRAHRHNSRKSRNRLKRNFTQLKASEAIQTTDNQGQSKTAVVHNFQEYYRLMDQTSSDWR